MQADSPSNRNKARKTSTIQGPSHVLFAVSPNRTPPAEATDAHNNESSVNNNTKVDTKVCCDPRLDTDYISKRQRAHKEFVGWKALTATTTTTSPWEGVSGFEQELVQCCEGLPDDYYESDDEQTNTANETDETDSKTTTMLPADPVGGVLAVEKEANFAALLSRGCHTMATKCLAMAILERTLEAYLEEEAARTLSNKNNNEPEDTEENGSKERLVRNQNLAATDSGNPRFLLFFAAGGLRILNQWLADASSNEITSKSSDGSSPRLQKQQQYKKDNSTRPIALSILHFLEHIPFDKKTVTNSKINKQVQKLGKKVASIQEAHEKQLATREDLDLWTVQNKAIHDKDVLHPILTAIDSVKASWREKAKGEKKQIQQKLEQGPPFGALQSKIKERLQELYRFDARNPNEKPLWYRKASTSRKRKAAAAATEAEMEKRLLQKKIKQMQSRSQKSLRQLREKLRMHNKHNINNSGKTVVWRDSRNRDAVLTDVVVFGKDLPPSSVGGADHSIE